MAFLINIGKKIKNNWKKTTFAALAITYGCNYLKEYYQIQKLMQVYCEKATQFGSQTILVDKEPRNVAVILNPNANKRKATQEFELYCAPLLHLAGINVNIIKTEFEGHAKTVIDNLNGIDAILVAGGDGTLLEVITGLLRRTQENTNGLVPLGILPLGHTNSLANILFPNLRGKVSKVKSLADATLAIVEENTKLIDVMKVEVMEGENKPIYAVAGIKWGAYRDAEVKRDNYWFYGKFRTYASYLFNGYKSNLTWNCEGTINFSPPCIGCTNCIINNQNNKWYKRYEKQTPSNAKKLNPTCVTIKKKTLSTVDFNVFTSNLRVTTNEIPKLILEIGPKNVNYYKFIQQGFNFENGREREITDIIEARKIEIQPKLSGSEMKEAWFSIDNENFEMKPIRITLLPKMINVFAKQKQYNV